MIWSLIARICAIPNVANWLIARAQRTPYTPIMSPDGETLYMGRWWLFNPYPGNGDERKRWSWLPSVRVHHICVEDKDRHLHDHPWNARTIILKGAYREQRPTTDFGINVADNYVESVVRRPGDTARLLFGEYHRIAEVSPGGAWTLFITWKYRGTWGFLVDGKKVPWREYLGVSKQ
jgi:hypothetical protein